MILTIVRFKAKKGDGSQCIATQMTLRPTLRPTGNPYYTYFLLLWFSMVSIIVVYW